MRRSFLAAFAVLLLTMLGAQPVSAGGPILCPGRVCQVSSPSDFVDALTELEGSSSPGRIELNNNISLPTATNPAYSGPGPLTIDGNGVRTLSGTLTSRIIDDTSGALLTFEAVTVTSGTSSTGSAPINASGPVRIVDSTISNNQSTSAGAITGGAITSGGAVTVENSLIDANQALSSGGNVAGGAIFALGKVTVTGSDITNNAAFTTSGTAEGGGVSTNDQMVLTGSALSDNDAVGSGVASGGGARAALGVTVTDATIEDNLADSDAATAQGGGIRSEDGATITRSIFLVNRAVGEAAAGGAIHVTGAGIHGIDDTLLRENTADADTGGSIGGAVYVNGGITRIKRSSIRDNNSLADSSDTSGAGIHAEGTTLTAIDTAIVRNFGDSTTGFGGGIRAVNSPVSLYNSTLAENIGPNGSGVWANQTITTRFATIVANKTTGGTGQVVTSGNYIAAATVVADADPSGVDTTDCAVASTSAGNGNYESGTSCTFTTFTNQQNGTEARLGPVRDNGGPPTGPAEIAVGPRSRLTMFPLPGSELIDAMTPGQCNSAKAAVTGLNEDQRDVPRPTGEGCDTGATEAVFPAHSFSDVIPFYEHSVRWITSDSNVPQILSGFSNGTFGHQLDITRGQTARFYYRAAGTPDVSGLPAHGFTDSIPFFEDAITWAVDEGIFLGFDDDTFRPADPITRGQYVRSLYFFAGSPNVVGLDHGFLDVSPFFADAVTWAKDRALVDGFNDNTFRQANNISRGNTTRIAYQLAQTADAWGLSVNQIPMSMIIKTNIDIF